MKSIKGHSSAYGPGFYGNLTASGWPFGPYTNVVASLVIPQHTLVDVVIPPQPRRRGQAGAWHPLMRTRETTIRSIVVDRGPYGAYDPPRPFDLSMGLLRLTGWFDPEIRDDALEREIAFLWGVRLIEIRPLLMPRG